MNIATIASASHNDLKYYFSILNIFGKQQLDLLLKKILVLAREYNRLLLWTSDLVGASWYEGKQLISKVPLYDA